MGNVSTCFLRIVRPVVLVAAAVLLSFPAVAGTLYRWVDARGVVNYSSEPPPAGAEVKAVSQHSMTSYDATAAFAAAERQNRELQMRLDQLQREVDALKLARTYAPAAPAPVAAAPQTAAPRLTSIACADDPRNNCARGTAPEYDYPPGTVIRTIGVPVYVVPVFPRPVTPRHPQTRSGLNVSFGGSGRFPN